MADMIDMIDMIRCNSLAEIFHRDSGTRYRIEEAVNRQCLIHTTVHFDLFDFSN